MTPKKKTNKNQKSIKLLSLLKNIPNTLKEQELLNGNIYHKKIQLKCY